MVDPSTRRRHGMREENHDRFLAHMRRAPGGHYTPTQLARNVGLTAAEVLLHLAHLEQAGYIRRSVVTIDVAFQLTPLGSQLPLQPAGRGAFWGHRPASG